VTSDLVKVKTLNIVVCGFVLGKESNKKQWETRLYGAGV